MGLFLRSSVPFSSYKEITIIVSKKFGSQEKIDVEGIKDDSVCPNATIEYA